VLRRVVSSTGLISGGYDDELELLEVQFWHGGVYQYNAVPREVYEELMQSTAIGVFFNERIRDTYQGSRVEP
jgi:hypothetical protein